MLQKKVEDLQQDRYPGMGPLLSSIWSDKLVCSRGKGSRVIIYLKIHYLRGLGKYLYKDLL